MNYFGTNLTSYGHYFWELEGERICRSNVDFKDIPFNPEYLVEYKPNGVVECSAVGEYSVCAISGSCKDSRPGSKSVFWVKAQIAPDELKKLILSTPIAQKIIEQMPFEVKW